VFDQAKFWDEAVAEMRAALPPQAAHSREFWVLLLRHYETLGAEPMGPLLDYLEDCGMDRREAFSAYVEVVEVGNRIARDHGGGMYQNWMAVVRRLAEGTWEG
jgi:hypothetical protein